MEVIYERCCGLDVHKNSVVSCVITPEGKEIRTFGTMTRDLWSLADWITSKGCTHVAMESTGVYWKPIYNILELTGIKILVVNAQHIKAVPGRKTDVKDAEWIADLLRHGLLQGSYIPDREQRELRELIGYRKSLIDERAREVNRMQKVLEGAGIKLASVATDISGVSGRAIIEAIVEGIQDPKKLAKLAKGRLKSKAEQLELALQGLVGPHQRRLLATQLRHIEFLDQEIARLDQEVEERMRPFEEEVSLLDTIPGVGRRNAEAIIACTGVDMSRFPTSAHISSWAGVAPGNNESAGKRKSGRTRKGNPLLRTTLIQAGRSAARSNDTYFHAQYNRVKARRGPNRAAVAVAHSLLIVVYHMLKTHQPYHELGADYFEKRRQKATDAVAYHIKALENLGYKVTVEVVA